MPLCNPRITLATVSRDTSAGGPASGGEFGGSAVGWRVRSCATVWAERSASGSAPKHRAAFEMLPWRRVRRTRAASVLSPWRAARGCEADGCWLLSVSGSLLSSGAGASPRARRCRRATTRRSRPRSALPSARTRLGRRSSSVTASVAPRVLSRSTALSTSSSVLATTSPQRARALGGTSWDGRAAVGPRGAGSWGSAGAVGTCEGLVGARDVLATAGLVCRGTVWLWCGAPVPFVCGWRGRRAGLGRGGGLCTGGLSADGLSAGGLRAVRVGPRWMGSSSSLDEPDARGLLVRGGRRCVPALTCSRARDARVAGGAPGVGRRRA